MKPRARGATAVIAAATLLGAGCGDSDGAPVEATVIGVVIAVDGTLAGVESFVLRLENGSDLTLVPAEGLLFDGAAPLTHIRDHLVSGNPVEATYKTSPEGPPVVKAIGDAGGTHDD